MSPEPQPRVVFVHSIWLDELRQCGWTEAGIIGDNEPSNRYQGEIGAFTITTIVANPSERTYTLVPHEIPREPKQDTRPKQGNLNAFLMKKQKRRY